VVTKAEGLARVLEAGVRVLADDFSLRDAAFRTSGCPPVSRRRRSTSSSITWPKATGSSGTEETITSKTLTFALMDAPYESENLTTAFRMLDIAARRGFEIKVFGTRARRPSRSRGKRRTRIREPSDDEGSGRRAPRVRGGEGRQGRLGELRNVRRSLLPKVALLPTRRARARAIG
jgi:hypothetical protein